MNRKKNAYEKATMRLFQNFDEAALDYGYEADQGSPENAEVSKNQYEEAKRNMIKRLNQLASAQRKLTKLRRQLHEEM